MSGEDTSELAVKVARVTAVQERQKSLERRVDRRNTCLVMALVAVVVALVLSFGHWFGKIEVPAGVISWLGPGLTTFLLLGALALQVAINQHRTGDEIRDSRPLSTSVLTELVAEHQANRALIRQLDQKIDDNERQRQSDVGQIREASAKRLDEIHDQVEQLKAALPSMLEDAARKGYAVGYTDALAQGGGGRPLRSV